MKHYQTINNLAGWAVFTIAAFTYCSTIEPTASYWDCPEFISSAYKLEIGHPPGAPFFMLLGNLFSQLANHPTQVARMVNLMNALLSAGCILLLFWTITHFARKLLVNDDHEPCPLQTIIITLSGTTGALIYCWSDTFWFSAVEAEVYAFSSFLTALVFWLILKWEEQATHPNSNRWIVLISYIIGLSIGVHLLGLLCIPAVVLVIYYRLNPTPTRKGVLFSLVIGFLLIALVLYVIVPGVVHIGGWFELFFVNLLHLPFNTGLIVYIVLLIILLFCSIRYTASHPSKQQLHLILRCFAALLVGYSSYAIIFIRSSACPMMDENHPADIFTLAQYLGREQYGERPLVWGPTYKSRPALEAHPDGTLTYAIRESSSTYRPQLKDKVSQPDRYQTRKGRYSPRYPDNQCMFFPRIWSDRHANFYEQWLGKMHTHPVSYTIPGNGTHILQLPTWRENFRFFLSYQLGHMYWRYFLWNFAGRQNDIQGHGEPEYGNWLSGFSLIDNWRLGKQSQLSDELKHNKGHNLFFCLPLMLGLLGIWRQASTTQPKARGSFVQILFLFLMTGLAIVVYLNQTPGQPRERDYAYTGSFYAYAIWCGLGVVAIFQVLCHIKFRRRTATLITVLCLLIPVQMVSQTWDDHDRSHRYTCRDFGLNYLQTIPHGGVIFTNADNDTFPLWYLQDTEGLRTDTRAVNMEYLQTDWYIDQMRRPSFDSPALPISWEPSHYQEGENEMIDVNPVLPNGQTMKQFILQLYHDQPTLACHLWGEDPFQLTTVFRHFLFQQYPHLSPHEQEIVRRLPPCIPTDTLRLTVDKQAVRQSGMFIPPEGIPDQMEISLRNQQRISKAFAILLDLIGQTNFRRPLYIAITVGPSTYGSLYRHFVLEGMAHRITPFTFPNNHLQDGTPQTVIDTKRLYDNLMQHYRYGNASHPNVYLDETTRRFVYTHRRLFLHLAHSLLEQGDKKHALLVYQRMEQELGRR